MFALYNIKFTKKIRISISGILLINALQKLLEFALWKKIMKNSITM